MNARVGASKEYISPTHIFRGFFEVFLRGFINMPPPGVELVLPS